MAGAQHEPLTPSPSGLSPREALLFASAPQAQGHGNTGATGLGFKWATAAAAGGEAKSWDWCQETWIQTLALALTNCAPMSTNLTQPHFLPCKWDSQPLVCPGGNPE